MFVSTKSANSTHRFIVAFLVAVGTLQGCAHLHKARPQKYQTVAASSRHDTEAAREYHREALVLLEAPVLKCDYAKAERLLNDALVADVTYGPAHNSLGTLYYMQSKLYLAAWEFEYAAKLMPDLAQPYNNLGLVYERAGKYDEAISYYSMALSREPNDPELTGNLVRSRMITGDRSADLKHMVSDLALNHTHPRWQKWARNQVELTSFEEDTTSLTNDWQVPEYAPEHLPVPVTEQDVLPSLGPELQLPQSVVPEG